MSEKRADDGFRFRQIGSASLVSLAHGTNDAQKTMGVITLALLAHGSIISKQDGVPVWSSSGGWPVAWSSRGS